MILQWKPLPDEFDHHFYYFITCDVNTLDCDVIQYSNKDKFTLYSVHLLLFVK